jgi:hypothetical protein
MFVAKTVSVGIAACMLLGLASCATTRGNLASSADQLEHSANSLARDVRDEPSRRDSDTSYVRDAHTLADDAHEFRRTAEDGRASNSDVRAAFDRVSRSYHVVRDDVEHSEDREVRSDFKAVTDAYLDIERELGGYPAERVSRAD